MMQLPVTAALLLHVTASLTQVLQSADTITRLAAQGADSALVAKTRESPDDVREALRQLLAQATHDSTGDALPSARRLASAYAMAWQDSFFVRRVDRFAQMTPGQRIAKARGDSLRLAGNTALERSGVDAAMRRWRDSHRIFERLADTAGVAAALGNLGIGFLRREDLDSAESYLSRSRDLATRIGDHRTAGNAMAALGDVSRVRGNLRAARELFTRAEATRLLTGDTRGLAADRNNLGLIDQDLGDLAAARKAFESALALNRAAGRDGPAATNLINLGNVLGLEANYGEALDSYGRALAIYRRDQSQPDIAFALHSIGALAMRRGDYRGATASLQEAAAIYGQTGPPVAELAARQDLFSARAAMGDLQGARAELQLGELLAASEPETESRETRARLALMRGDLELQFNRLRDAEREYARAVELTRGTTDVSTRAAAQQGIGMLLLIRENYTRAQPALELALRAQEAAGERRAAALSRLLIAYAARHRGDTTLARRAIRRALDTLDVLGDAVGQAAALGALGDLELSNGLRLTAESLYHRGLARLGARSAPDVAWQLHAGVARASAARGDRAAASDALRRALREIERVSGTLAVEERRAEYLADKWDVYVELALVEQGRGRTAAAFEVSEQLRARQMLDLLARGRVVIGAAAELVEQEQDTRRRITELTTQLEVAGSDDAGRRGRVLAGDERGAALEALAQAQQTYGELLIRMREKHPAYASMVRGDVASLAELQAALSRDDLLLEYVVGDSTLLVFAITRDSIAALDLNVSQEVLAPLVDFARATLSMPRTGNEQKAWRAPMRRLYGHLIAPLEERGLLAGKRRLLIAPHAELHYLPFAALLKGDATDDLLLHRFVIEYIPSASVWLKLRERPQSARGSGILALAPRTDRLPGSRAEVGALRRLYGPDATVLIGAEATERAFRTLAPKHDVLHLATFGVLNKHNPLFSFVELRGGGGEDGRLETHEVFGLELSASLIVLSACQTGVAAGSVADVPPGDDWVGLVRTFLFAGASNVVATLWPVEDRSTAVLMEQFYGHLSGGRSPAESLVEAQRRAARQARTAHPFYWAGFALVSGR
jgi:CHAT domain-containing protein/Tfp pilus assembly protein PilF